ncbi:MAG: hypothetical protein HRT67_12375 [Flavobacteriaceae bacterium]|nr:hypothetical protein [Flavobacteriaceae bacterium]
MIDRFLTYYNYGDRFLGIEHTQKKDETLIKATLLKQSKNQVLIEDYIEAHSIKSIPKKRSKNQHIHLVINNDKVLTKTIESDQNNGLQLVYKAFPNINLDEFYYEILSQMQTHHIALCRKAYLEDIIKQYSEHKLAVIAISLGHTIIGTLCNFLSEDFVFTSNAKIHIEGSKLGKIIKTEPLSESYEINGLQVTNNQLLSFSAALQTVLKNNKVLTNFSDRTSELHSDYKESRFFYLFLKTGIFFILGLLLINFFFFNFYFNKVGELTQLSKANQSTKNQILKLDDIVSKKEKMVHNLLKSNSSKSSFYANAIMQSLPNSILLDVFNYQPLLKRIKANKNIDFSKNTIILEGNSNNSQTFSNWLSLLDHKDWISKVNILDYGSASSKVSNFKIEIVLKDD